ncbi:uncharacterized protein si:ch211-107e6.5 [Megalobrama amblycephala]|uniref:uncharacterized protein si:ch211-107e6.5 n=1 Tax=Megalobrama amblycephala TaxID=75352 RepID=UPI00201447CC|nr:uncharacterized protein si:ch211-107e6.5 [Megalobrama amblycephala]
MQQKTDLRKQEVIEISSAMNKVKSCCQCRPRAVFRLLVNLHGTSNPYLNQEQFARTSSPTSSVIHPIGQGHHQKKWHADTQERCSQETEKQMDENITQTQTKHVESPFRQKEQSLLKRAIRILFIWFIILGVIVIFMIAGQYVYLEAGRVSRSWDLDKCMNGFVKLRFVGMYNPPI